MFLSFQLLEKGFEQPRMTGWGNNAVLARLVDALDKRTGPPWPTRWSSSTSTPRA